MKRRMRVALACLLLSLTFACGQSNPGTADASTGGGSQGGGAAGGTATGGGSAGGGSAGGGSAMGGGNGGGTAWVIADHPPLPTLSNPNHNPVLTHPAVHYVFYTGYPHEAALETFAGRMTDAGYWPTTTSEYGVSGLSYAGKFELDGGAPATLSQGQLNQQVTQLVQSGTLGAFDPQGIYTFVFPASTTLTMPNPVLAILGNVSSCTAFGGYHDNAPLPLDDGGLAQIAYAAIPTCDTSVDTLTETLSHEWIESSTDPYLSGDGGFTFAGGPQAAYFTVDPDHAIWAVMGGGEAGDLCENGGSLISITPPDIGNVVQRTWSNLSAAGSHDPCVPAISGPFFDSAPVLPDTVNFNSFLTGAVTSKGVVIAPGTSKTLDVKLFSDGPTSGPWTVQADDLLYKMYGTSGLTNTLSFTWDKTTGQNGDTLHVTVTVTATSPLLGGGHVMVITSSLGNRTAQWPALIVEQ
jgi:hypothetical protein